MCVSLHLSFTRGYSELIHYISMLLTLMRFSESLLTINPSYIVENCQSVTEKLHSCHLLKWSIIYMCEVHTYVCSYLYLCICNIMEKWQNQSMVIANRKSWGLSIKLDLAAIKWVYYHTYVCMHVCESSIEFVNHSSNDIMGIFTTKWQMFAHMLITIK